MQSSIRVSLGGAELDMIPDIVVQTVEEAAPKYDIGTQNLGSGHGRYVTSVDRRSREIKITVGIMSTDPVVRQRARENLSVWAAKARDGAYMEMSTRMGQKLRVISTGFPSVKEMTKLTETITVTFESLGDPWWKMGKTVASITSGEAHLLNPGTAEAPLQFALTATATTVVVTMSSKTMTFTAAVGNTLTLTYDDRGLQVIKKNSTVCASCRDESSQDDLWVQPGSNTVTVTGATGQVSVEGRMLS